MLLNKKVVYITGGSSGIGQACAKLCLENGASVIITGRDIKKLEETKRNLSKISANLETHQFDMLLFHLFRQRYNIQSNIPCLSLLSLLRCLFCCHLDKPRPVRTAPYTWHH